MPRKLYLVASIALFALTTGPALAGTEAFGVSGTMKGQASVKRKHVHATPIKYPDEPAEIVYYADAYADHYGVPRPLVHAVIHAESDWHPNLVSDKGAMGLMQLMPSTARTYGVRDPFSVIENLSGGTRYLADLINRFRDLRLVAAAYYCGSHPLEKRGLNYSNREVSDYVQEIRRYYDDELQRHQSDTLRP
jgi:soluble lytic murein transglycosylase-like protein